MQGCWLHGMLPRESPCVFLFEVTLHAQQRVNTPPLFTIINSSCRRVGKTGNENSSHLITANVRRDSSRRGGINVRVAHPGLPPRTRQFLRRRRRPSSPKCRSICSDAPNKSSGAEDENNWVCFYSLLALSLFFESYETSFWKPLYGRLSPWTGKTERRKSTTRAPSWINTLAKAFCYVKWNLAKWFRISTFTRTAPREWSSFGGLAFFSILFLMFTKTGIRSTSEFLNGVKNPHRGDIFFFPPRYKNIFAVTEE